MTPREQLRKMTSLGEQGALDEKHWYRLVNGMSAGELRQRQELLMRNQMSMAPQILAQGQQRLQGVPAQFEPRFMERELVPPAEMVASDARQMHMALTWDLLYLLTPTSSPAEDSQEPNGDERHPAPKRAGEPSEGAHGHGQPHGLPPNAMAYRGRQRMSDGHDVFVHRPTLDELHSNSILMSASPYPPISTLHRERGRRAGRRPAVHKTSESPAVNIKGPVEDKNVEQSPGATSGEEREAEAKGELEGDKSHHQTKTDPEPTTGSRKSGENGLRKVNNSDGCGDGTNGSANDKDLTSGAFQDKFMYPSAAGMPYMVPMMGNGFLPPGPSNLFLNGEEVSEDIRKWTVNDVYNFINSIPTCSEYAQTFKDHMIDGETLPMLSEEHLLDTLGLKLGPALKIRSQVSRRMGSLLYLMNMPLSGAGIQGPPEKPGDRSSEMGSPVNCNSDEMVASPRDPDLLKSSDPHETENHSPPSASSETA
ncbi:hypothetical protein WMY93_000445 [Mugilogobius chulae]|uniref:SAM domain-containing protein n=1 Tax=Mugilogobius chulae TaxID=88201 RepID=A0AAW0Q2G7_9GOBI